MRSNNSLRWLILIPAIFGAASQARAESYELECREVEVEWTGDPVYWCKRDWNPPGSRIPEEQRTTLNAVVLLTVVAPLSRQRR